ncbi:MAG: type II toxin-antitoxin system RelE/ParE family toxin [Candidatus Hadarchaeota archaeon]
MKYEVRWTEASLRQLKKLDKRTAGRIFDKVESISQNPFAYVQKLMGLGLYRLRVGEYRVIVSIERKKMVVFVLEVGHRSVVYRKY